MLPKVSVIITCYNYVRFVEQAIRSVMAQTYPNLECIIIDDHSRDGSYALACSVIEGSDPAVYRAIRLGENAGQMKAFRAGLENTDGRFVVFLDADDALDPRFVETHVAVHLNSMRGAAMTASNTRTVDDTGQVLEGTFYAFGDTMPGEPPLLEIPAARLAELALPSASPPVSARPVSVRYRQPIRRGWPYSATSSFMFRRDVLDLIVSAHTDSVRICADYLLVQLASAIGGSLLIEQVLGDYRVHASNNFTGAAVTGAWRRPRHAQTSQLMAQIDGAADDCVKRNRDAFAALLPDSFFQSFVKVSSLKQELVRFWDSLPRWLQDFAMPLADYIDARIK